MSQEPEDDDLEPEYDFSEAERGKYYPRSQASGFAKKTEKTPRQEIDVASARRQDYRSGRQAQ